MKRTTTPRTLSLVVATVFVLGIVPGAEADPHRGCSAASLSGSFGFTSTGTLLPPAVPAALAGPFGEIGRQTFDGAGNTNGTATLSANGNIVTGVTIEGTYEVRPNCTGSMEVHINPINVTAVLEFVIDDGGDELRAIATAPGTIETRVYRKQFPQGHKPIEH
jgi:hypothetical protein